MSRKGQSILMLALIVVLLTMISARIVPPHTELNNSAVSEDELYLNSEETAIVAAEATETAEETEQPVEEDPRASLPKISLAEWNMRMANNTYVLPSSFAPNVVQIENGQYLDERAVEALQTMLDAANEANFRTCVVTGYRPFSTQSYLFFGKASQIAWDGTVEYAEAEELARSIVAYPGTSEHQTGLAVDILDSASTSMIAEECEELPTLQWLTKHCAEYGFILRYPKDKQDITGWYEPWHFRYVGVEVATYIMENDLCMEEFIALY